MPRSERPAGPCASPAARVLFMGEGGQAGLDVEAPSSPYIEFLKALMP
jgi:hypothetical protein